MNIKEIEDLGWHKDSEDGLNFTFTFAAKGFDYHIMSVSLNFEGDFSLVMIKCLPEKTKSNIWENSETNFYGQLKHIDDLNNVMRFIGIIEY